MRVAASVTCLDLSQRLHLQSPDPLMIHGVVVAWRGWTYNGEHGRGYAG